MLEKMAEFFEARLDGYDDHMLRDIDGAKEFYPFTAELLPRFDGCEVLDLGCGTGLELEFYFRLNPTARVTGVDLSSGMLEALKQKFSDKAITLINDSYFDIRFYESVYDAAVSVESLHHFTKEEKTSLYKNVYKTLRDDGCFVLTDYFAKTEQDELFFRAELQRLKNENGINDSDFYHYDTPLTVEHELEALRDGGFKEIQVLKNWGATYTIKAKKSR